MKKLGKLVRHVKKSLCKQFGHKDDIYNTPNPAIRGERKVKRCRRCNRIKEIEKFRYTDGR